MQTELTLDRWLNSGRDRPKGLTFEHWSYLLALIVHGGGVRFTEAEMLDDLHARVLGSERITALAQLDSTTATHWCWAWETYRPDIKREIDRRRAERQANAELRNAGGGDASTTL